MRVAELEQLMELAEAIAGAGALDELLQIVVSGARPLLSARACHLYLLDPGSEELDASPAIRSRETRGTHLALRSSARLARGGRSTRVAVPLVANDELIGLVVAEGSGVSSSAAPSRARSRSA